MKNQTQTRKLCPGPNCLLIENALADATNEDELFSPISEAGLAWPRDKPQHGDPVSRYRWNVRVAESVNNVH